MFRGLFLVFGLLPSMGMADGWVAVTEDAEIQSALSNRALRYDALTFQFFGAGGETKFVTERSSDGRWAARAGQYCSQWPPSDGWTCYDLELNGERVRFIAADGSISEGIYEN